LTVEHWQNPMVVVAAEEWAMTIVEVVLKAQETVETL
jgi:hypothetical protein